MKQMHAEWRDLYEQGKTQYEIAEQYGVNQSSVSAILAKFGVKCRLMTVPKLTAAQQAEAAEGYKSGKTLLDLANVYGVSFATIANTLERNGVARRTSDTWRRLPVRHDAFATITDESLYWVGFLMAGGNVCHSPTGKHAPHIQLALQIGDAPHIHKFKAFMGASHAVFTGWKTGLGGVRSYARITFTSRQVAENLATFGVVPRKSIVGHLQKCEDEPAIWRGMIDGDGSVYMNGVGVPCVKLCGGRPILEQFHRFVSRRVPSSRANISKLRPNGIGSLSLNGRHAAALAEILYADASVFLDRKKAAADSAVSWYWSRSCPLELKPRMLRR